MQYILLLKLGLTLESGGEISLGDALAETRATKEELAANPLLKLRRLYVNVLYYPLAEEERRRTERCRRIKISRSQRERAANSPRTEARTATQTLANQPNDRDISETSRRRLEDISETSSLQQSKLPEYASQKSLETLKEIELDRKRHTSNSIYTPLQDTTVLPTVREDLRNKDGRGVGDARGRGEGNALSAVWSNSLLFRLRDGSTWKASEELLNTFRIFYKESEIRDNFRLAAVWLETNPARRKTEAGMPNFLGAWLARARKAAK